MKILEEHIVPAISENIRLQEYATGIFHTITSKSGIKKAIKREEILIDGKVAQTSDWVREKQTITLLQQHSGLRKIFKLKLEVIYEDEYLAVINKPAGYPTSGNYFKTIENALPYNLSPSQEKDALPHPLPVHRLDNPTSGLLIIAKTRQAQVQLYSDFENKMVKKEYLALVLGSIPGEITISDELDGKAAVTRVRLISRLNIDAVNFSLVTAMPETGRTHQIRKHLSAKGFPIAGDNIYGKNIDDRRLRGLYLTALAIDFSHPVNNSSLKLSLPHPKRFRVLQDLTGSSPS